MSKQVFINLPVANVARSIAFFEALGFPCNPQLMGEDGGCIISDSIFATLYPHEKSGEFTPKAICDTSKAAEELLNLTARAGKKLPASSRRPLRRVDRPTTNLKVLVLRAPTAFSTLTAMVGGSST